MRKSCYLWMGFITCFFILQIPAYTQTDGCTDPQAVNFLPAATINDGSCTYPVTVCTPLRITALPSDIRETSGLNLHEGILWTHNDSGWSPDLFGMDTLTGAILKQVHVVGAQNIDWEDIASDGTHLYLGDFGNNIGNRQDLLIYKIRLSDLDQDSVAAEAIAFHYPDQFSFEPASQNHNFDMEAMICMGDSLYLFSKNWADQATRVYRLPKIPGTYTADLIDSFQVNGLITGAEFYEPDSLIVLTGYSRLLQPFIWMLWDFQGHRILSGNKRRIELNLPFHQVEAIASAGEPGTFFITNERFSNIITTEAALHRLSLKDFLTDTISTSQASITLPDEEISLYPNPVADTLYFSIPGASQEDIQATIISYKDGSILKSLTFSGTKPFIIPVKEITPGVYFLQIKYNGRIMVRKFTKT
jgi:hypothetical protein